MTALVELCAGSAAVSTRALGYRYPLLTYQGGKGRYAKAILAELGVVDKPERVVLVDPGPWGTTWATLGLRVAKEEVTDELARLATWAPPGLAPDGAKLRIGHKGIAGDPVPTHLTYRVVDHLFLQALNWGNKAVGIKDGRWVTHGFNTSAANGVEKTPRYGGVKPALPKLIRRLKKWDLSAIEGIQDRAEAIVPIPGSVVYIDPPYQGTTGYVDTFSRWAVIAVAKRWHEAGCVVGISESEPLDIPGARHVRLGTRDASLSRSGKPKPEEWLTVLG